MNSRSKLGGAVALVFLGFAAKRLSGAGEAYDMGEPPLDWLPSNDPAGLAVPSAEHPRPAQAPAVPTKSPEA